MATTEVTEKQNVLTYKIAAVSTIFVLMGVVLDLIVGNITGGNISELPETAIDRFAQFQHNWLLGLYNMDLLNTIIQFFMIPAYVALFIAHRNENFGLSLLAFVIFILGTSIFISNNTALTMFDLSRKFASAATEQQKMLIAAAGEAMLTKGAHGSLGVFFSFAIPDIAGILMSIVMLNAKIFSKATSCFGLIGSSLLLIYIILVTFFPAVESVALAMAAPGGICCMVWMILLTIRFFKL